MKSYPIYLRFWFNWFILTVVYHIFVFINMMQNYDSLPLYLKIIGKFVPIGFWSLFLVFSHGGYLPYLIILSMLLVLVVSDFLSKKLGIQSIPLKIIFNLAILFALESAFQILISSKIPINY